MELIIVRIQWMQFSLLTISRLKYRHEVFHFGREGGVRYCTLRTLAALQRLRLIIQMSSLGSYIYIYIYMRKSPCNVIRVSIGRRGRGVDLRQSIPDNWAVDIITACTDPVHIRTGLSTLQIERIKSILEIWRCRCSVLIPVLPVLRPDRLTETNLANNRSISHNRSSMLDELLTNRGFSIMIVIHRIDYALDPQPR